MIPSSTIVLTAATHQDLDELPEKELWIGLKSIIQVKTYRYVFKNGYLIFRYSHKLVSMSNKCQGKRILLIFAIKASKLVAIDNERGKNNDSDC
jgi:hypothetical protein